MIKNMIFKKKIFYTTTCLFFLIIIAFYISITIGSIKIKTSDIFNALFFNCKNNDISLIVRYLRLPRFLVIFITGAGLAASGCVFQTILKNPLVDSFTLGISSGAAFGVTIAFVFKLTSITNLSIPICAIFGVIVSVIFVYYIGIRKNFSSHMMVLSGVIISYIFSSAVMLMFALSSYNNIQAAFVWLMGGFSEFDEKLIPIIFVIVILGIVILSFTYNIINILSLEKEKLKTLGMNIEKNIKFLFLIASFITAATVSICGVVGFIGLIIPHIIKKIVGENNFFLIPLSAVSGAIFLLFCDIINRILFNPITIPISIITSTIGGIFFIFIQFMKFNNGEK
jgi:iron complex transport system permease protein